MLEAKTDLNTPLEEAVDAPLPALSLPEWKLGKAMLPPLNPEEFRRPGEILDALKEEPFFKALLEAPAVREGYSIEEHTYMVLQQFERYFDLQDFDNNLERETLPPQLTDNEYFVALALHDIGKGVSNDRTEQHEHTGAILERLRGNSLLSERGQAIVEALVSADPIGQYFKDAVTVPVSAEQKVVLSQAIARREPEVAEKYRAFCQSVTLRDDREVDYLASRAAKTIREMAAKTDLTPLEFFDILTVYYKADALAYTVDAPRDRGRSPVFGPEELEKILFTNDRILQSRPGLSTNIEGGVATISDHYRELENESRANPEKGFPYDRGYPSLDFLFAISPHFDPTAPVGESRAFERNKTLGQPRFNEQIEVAFQLLRRKLS